MTYCPCNQYNELPSAGMSAGGAAVVTLDKREGGCVLGGAAIVYPILPEASAIYPLGYSYDDVSGNGLHGYVIDSEFEPVEDDGVFCLSSSLFEGRDFIHIPSDTITGEFSVSCWVRTAKKFGEEVFISRGVKTSSTDWLFTLGTSYVNQLMCRLQLAGDEVKEYRVYSTERLQVDRWHHVSCSWKPQEALRVFVNGTLVSSSQTPESATVSYSGANNGYLGRWNNGKGFTGNLQEVRVFPIAKSESHWKAEKDNFCNPTFVLVGEVEEAVFE